MCIIDIFKDWGGHIFSICGIIGGLFMYYHHDKRIKKQEQLLNDFQIKQYRKAEEQEKQAKVECAIIHVDNGTRKVRFYNSGLADAYNVRVEILNSNNLDRIVLLGKWGPYDLITSRNGSREEKIMLNNVYPDVLKLRIMWDDDFENDRSIIQSPQL